MPQQDPSRTEHATPKRRDKARGEGNVPKSQELSKTVVLLAGLVGLTLYVDYMAKHVLGLYHWFFTQGPELALGPQTVYAIFVMVARNLAVILLPLLLFLGLVAYLAVRIQVGSLWTTKVFKPKLSKHFNIMAGLKRMFVSPKTFIRLGRSLLQAIAIGIAPYIVLKNEMDNLLPLFFQNAEGVAAYMLTTGAKMVIYALLPMLIIAVADLVYTRWDYEEQLKMTKQEVKDERKQAEGDPRIKAQQRRKMLEVSMMRMMQNVPKADVVITNPTHFAVALSYNPMEAPAPVVLAKGVDFLAQKIKEVARENKVPIKENKPLAQALYKMVEIGEMIPEEMYQAVAAVLAELYRDKKQRAQNGI